MSKELDQLIATRKILEEIRATAEEASKVAKRAAVFIAAFDAWANSAELCGGPLFAAMLKARENIQ